VELMTSGAFARASGLSRKALRLYDELGLLHPAQVDPVTSYRFYDPGQLEQARLVAWLRRLGMPLADIRAVAKLPADRAATELAAYWARVEAETSARRELAVFLIGYLSGSQLGLAHIGDSRAYLVRDGEVFQITQDHTLVQSLIDEGKITAEEAASHPQRLLLLRALTGEHTSRPDLQLRQAQLEPSR
jgi:DNA-binding transcriptional MerR regulator